MLHAVTGKRKRQENFQSRKRQAATEPTGASNHAQIADAAQDTNANPEVTAALGPQLSQPTQHKAAAAMNATAASTPPLAAQLTMQTAQQQTNLVSHSMEPNSQLQPQMQDQALPGPAADAISPVLDSVTSPLPVAQPEVQGVSLCNDQGTTSGLQELARGNRQGLSSQRYVVTKPVNDARGHTGYLTFARRSVDG